MYTVFKGYDFVYIASLHELAVHYPLQQYFHVIQLITNVCVRCGVGMTSPLCLRATAIR